MEQTMGLTLHAAVEAAKQQAQTIGHAMDVYLDTNDGTFVVLDDHVVDESPRRPRYKHIGTAFPDQIATVQRYDAETKTFVSVPTHGTALPGDFYYG